MDIIMVENDNKFFYRVSAIILNKDLNKVLLFRVKDRDLYMLLGGKVKMLEESNKAIITEIREEIGYEKIDFEFLGNSEELLNDKSYINAIILNLIITFVVGFVTGISYMVYRIIMGG